MRALHPRSAAVTFLLTQAHTALGNGVADFLTGAKDAQTTLKDIAGAYTTSAKEAGLIK